MALLFGGGDTSVGGAAHNHKPAPSLGKKHLHPTNEYHSWDYLKGSGPAAPSARHPDDKPRFKPGWKVRKPERNINAWRERAEFEARKSAQFEKYQEQKKVELEQRSSHYNPISGEVKAEGVWSPATDPWAHIQSGKKFVKPPAIVSQEKKEKKEISAKVRAELRRDRLLNEGLVRPKGDDTVKKVLDYS